MNSLVGYGVSSDSDSDGDVNKGRAGSVKEVSDGAAAARKSRNFLLESGSASSDSESESEPGDEDPEPVVPPPTRPHSSASSAASHPVLPAPSLGSKLPSPPLVASSDSSVFANPFKAQAEQKLSALQKHVPLTMQAKPSQIGGKRMCVSYRKDGRCRFGIKCKFAHDSDLQTPVIPGPCHPPESEETSAPAKAGGSSSGGGSQNLRQDTKEEESEGQQMKKRRVGLSNTLIPPKRAMKQYAILRDRERLHMS
ncbi:uncharacterized protein si:ch211-113e8.11 [Mugil cephalus]|uniref:uncharacterized protein si:ch211-113e8.11 n=1 Tax=Mugil cephalus TaxID=48193 RepID=UPI001FB7E613|nr:uncharacterized protein si:ch211-113e8.11 [Mugil cephalus]